jgi:hypothetical protein
MGFSSSISEYFWTMVFVAWLFVFLGAKIVTTIDDDGAIKKTANDRFTSWLKGLFK